MTRLRKMMLDELERRNYSQTTRRAYLLGVEQFAKHFQRSPDQLGLDHLRDYQVHLFRVRKIKPATVAVRLAALRFLFEDVSGRDRTPHKDQPYEAIHRQLSIASPQGSRGEAHLWRSWGLQPGADAAA